MKHPFSKRPHTNLVQNLRLAESLEEIDQILAFGATFENASEKTRSRWHEASKQRRAQLSSNGHSADTVE